MSWEFASSLDAAARAAIESGKPLIYVCPPATWAALPLFDHLWSSGETGLETIVLAPGPSEAAELTDTLTTRDARQPICLVSGLARAARRLGAGPVRTLITTPSDAVQLVGRSQLRSEGVRHVVVLWPEIHATLEAGALLDTVLEAFSGTQRLVVTRNPLDAEDFLNRHAYRAATSYVSRTPQVPLRGVRYAVVPPEQLRTALRAALDVLNPASTLLWDPSPLAAERWRSLAGDPTVHVSAVIGAEPVDLAIAVDLPSGEALAALGAVAKQSVVLIRPHQLPYLRQLADPLGVLRLPSEVDRARDRAGALRRKLRDRLEAESDPGALYAIAPLLDEWDPALVAAAALQLAEPGAGAPTPQREGTHWVRVRLDAGRRERLRAGDVVGALLNAVGLARHQVGRVDIREGFSVVDVRAEAAERAVKGLDGLVVRGRRIGARTE